VRFPNCGGDTTVSETREGGNNELRRRRACTTCKLRFTTRERIAPPQLRVEKRKGGTEPYDRLKLRRALARVCRHRPIGDEHLDAFVDRIEAELTRAQARSVRWSHLVVLVLDVLRTVDRVSAQRLEANYLDDTGVLRLDEALPRGNDPPQLGLFDEPAGD
jgi:transcriptional repressor NrdR